MNHANCWIKGENMPYFVLFDDAYASHSILLQDWVAQDCLSAHELSELDERLEQGWQKGWHVALFADYEWGLALQKLPENPHFSGSLRLFWFKTKQEITDVPAFLEAQTQNQVAGISTPSMNIDESAYHKAIEQIHEAIRCGDTYQINYTVRLHLQAYGSPMRLYHRLRQNVPYGVLARLPENHWILSFSPELFLRIHADGIIQTEPMKGTAPRLGDGLDEMRAISLQNDPKNRAENTMIVDLLRNDLGKLAKVGGVSVPEPFKVRAFGSVWQMTSLVQASVPARVSVAEVLKASFPCGSITGAPKRKSMEWIGKLETEPRGLYTGSIGFLEPQADSVLGWRACLNVVIRTLQLVPNQNSATFQGTYGVGSGIVIDSCAADEFAECGWKARFLNELRPEFGLFETMRVENQRILRLPEHLKRLRDSALALNIPFDIAQAEQKLIQIQDGFNPKQIYRLKCSLSPQGCLNIATFVLDEIKNKVQVCISPQVLPERDYLRRFKTDQRAVFDQVWQAAEAKSCFDGLIFNEHGLLLEGGRSSVMIEEKGQTWVVAEHLDILNSLMRQEAIAQGAKETEIDLQRLRQADRIWVGNALRGWLEAEIID